MYPRQRNNRVYTKNETLLHNVVQRNFQNYLRPLNILQTWVAYPKYLIRDNFITPNGLWTNLLSLAVTCVYMVFTVNRAMTFNTNRTNVMMGTPKIRGSFFIMRSVNFFLYTVGHFNNLYSNYHHRDRNVTLVIKIQETLNKLPKKRKLANESFFNWLYGILILLDFYFFYIVLNCAHRSRCTFFELMSDLVLLGFHVNMLYAIRIMSLIKGNILSWICEIEGIKRNNIKIEPQYWLKMFEIYSLIMDSYIIYIQVFQELVLYFIIDTFLHTLIYVQVWLILIEADYNNSKPTLNYFLSSIMYIIISWVGTHLLFISILGRETERFYIAMERVQALSLKLLGTGGCDEAEKRMYKKVYRLHCASFVKVNLKGMYDVDATLTIKLAQVIAANIVILLQFAFKTT